MSFQYRAGARCKKRQEASTLPESQKQLIMLFRFVYQTPVLVSEYQTALPPFPHMSSLPWPFFALISLWGGAFRESVWCHTFAPIIANAICKSMTQPPRFCGLTRSLKDWSSCLVKRTRASQDLGCPHGCLPEAGWRTGGGGVDGEEDWDTSRQDGRARVGQARNKVGLSRVLSLPCKDGKEFKGRFCLE